MGNITSPLAARPTIYKGIEMRSRLEATIAAGFDRAGLTWEYEPCAFADGDGQYLPDFRYQGERGGPVYVEVKGVVHDPGPILRRMRIIWSSQPDVTLMLVEGIFSRVWEGWHLADGSPTWIHHNAVETVVLS